MYIKIDFPQIGVHLYESKHKKGARVLEHYHDVYQILYALDGEGIITIKNKKYQFEKDRMLLIVPNTNHSVQTDKKLTVLVLAFKSDQFQPDELEGIMKYFNNESSLLELDQFTASMVRQVLRKMLFEQREYDRLFKYAIPNYLKEILITLARFKLSNQYENLNELRSFQISEYINRHYYENISANHLSKHFGISTRYMNGLFKAKFNETPLQYLHRVRINRAKQLLAETDKEILSICFEIGYETVSTFYRTFNNIVGLSPNKYRMIHASQQEIEVSES